MKDAMLSVQKISKRYDGLRRPALNDVSLTLRRGEVLCLVGPSGGGKSTLLRCLAGLESIDRGSISVSEPNLIRIGPNNDPAPLRSIGTYVFQDYNLWPHKTVLENITLAPVLTEQCTVQNAEQQARELLRKFGLYDKRHSYPSFLSGGQRQRVALIRAIAIHPAVLYLDEITSALDPFLIASVLEAIQLLARDGQSMVITTHHLAFAAEVATNLVYLEDGAVVGQGTPATFIRKQKNPRIREFLRTLGR